MEPLLVLALLTVQGSVEAQQSLIWAIYNNPKLLCLDAVTVLCLVCVCDHSWQIRSSQQVMNCEMLKDLLVIPAVLQAC